MSYGESRVPAGVGHRDLPRTLQRMHFMDSGEWWRLVLAQAASVQACRQVRPVSADLLRLRLSDRVAHAGGLVRVVPPLRPSRPSPAHNETITPIVRCSSRIRASRWRRWPTRLVSWFGHWQRGRRLAAPRLVAWKQPTHFAMVFISPMKAPSPVGAKAATRTAGSNLNPPILNP
jgi:hypothetical protein